MTDRDDNQLLTLRWNQRSTDGPEVYDLRVEGAGVKLLTGVAYRSHAGGGRANVAIDGAKFVTTRGSVRDAIRLMNHKLKKHFAGREVTATISREPVPGPALNDIQRVGGSALLAKVPRREVPIEVTMERLLPQVPTPSSRKGRLRAGATPPMVQAEGRNAL